MGPTTKHFLAALPEAGTGHLLAYAREVSYPAGTRLFEEGRRADRFWVLGSGTVTLDLHRPGRRAAVVDSVGPGELLGWSWLFPPHTWELGGETLSPVRAMEFDALAVRALCDSDPVLGRAVYRHVARTVVRRLRASRARLLDTGAARGDGG
ncbi:Crp/Fnr family transcriptional regulator [Streptomyces specialis]|uniref:Crp/Fnr family transcriptional regulator n=1 Tax=Streptomyces specialis TaxID=498367 RepID=UPI00073E1DCB|nr:cyclic nucleotide-binding domain-containing protein [Streptomyces specialis]